MKKKIFVGNLPWKATEDVLRSLFEAHGTVVSVKIITDQYTGKSKGFGFVEMETDEEAERAIQKLHDTELLGRQIRVSLAQERPAGERSERGERGERGPRPSGPRPSRSGFGSR